MDIMNNGSQLHFPSAEVKLERGKNRLKKEDWEKVVKMYPKKAKALFEKPKKPRGAKPRLEMLESAKKAPAKPKPSKPKPESK